MPQAAEEATQKSLDVYDAAGDKVEAALSRDQLGLIFEEQGRFAYAKDVRLRGASEGMIARASIVVS